MVNMVSYVSSNGYRMYLTSIHILTRTIDSMFTSEDAGKTTTFDYVLLSFESDVVHYHVSSSLVRRLLSCEPDIY